VTMKTLPPEDHRVSALILTTVLAEQERYVVHLGVLHTEHWRVGLLLLEAGKNVLCEKPFAMNARQLKDLVEEAEKSPFVFSAIWSRCFPVHAEVRRLLQEEAVGEVKLVTDCFGSRQLHIPRWVEKELGGGALLDIGVYCLQFVLMVFNGERPESIQATGVLLDSGVDESVIVVMKFSRKRMAVCAFSIAAQLPNDAIISGTEGSVLGPMHCPTECVVNDRETEHPLPEPCLPLNFTNSTGLLYEAEEVRRLKESPRMPLAESVLLTEIMDEIREQVGVIFNQDRQ
uniref:Trans-1,2-dihydrobenzene-1,2-diol dehydrogenase n=1 Tax=Nothobranchius furzeri TaxID=105023 RepID=A0A8C6LF08_NOTFU